LNRTNVWSLWLARPSLRLHGPDLRLAGTALGLTRPDLGLARSSGLYLRTVIRFAGTKAGARHWLARLCDLPWPCARLAGAIDFARTVARIGACNSGLCGDGPGSRDQGGPAFIHVVKLLAVLRCFALVLNLGCHRWSAWPAEGFDLGGPWAHINAAPAAVVGDAGDVVHHDGAVVDVSDAGDIDAVDGAVVVEVVASPIAAVVAIAGVAEAIVDAAVETDVKAPVTAVEAPAVVIPTPISRGPQSAIVGGSAPCAGNPVVAGWTPVPVTGGPDIVWRRGLGLLVFG